MHALKMLGSGSANNLLRRHGSGERHALPSCEELQIITRHPYKVALLLGAAFVSYSQTPLGGATSLLCFAVLGSSYAFLVERGALPWNYMLGCGQHNMLTSRTLE